MMKAKHIMKVLALALPMALASPLLNAQSDGFFNGRDIGNQTFGTSDGGYGIGNQTVGQDYGDDSYGINIENFGEAPLGGGMAILVASAAGYALLKRRKSSKPQTPNNLKHLNS